MLDQLCPTGKGRLPPNQAWLLLQHPPSLTPACSRPSPCVLGCRPVAMKTCTHVAMRG